MQERKRLEEAIESDIRITGLTDDLDTLFELAREGELVDGEIEHELKRFSEILEELETRLLTADVGVEATEHILAGLQKRVARNELKDVAALISALQASIVEILGPCAKPLVIDESRAPFVILVVGVNGSGKTTTIGKLARRLADGGKTVMLAAGDTFRAAAIEQLFETRSVGRGGTADDVGAAARFQDSVAERSVQRTSLRASTKYPTGRSAWILSGRRRSSRDIITEMFLPTCCFFGSTIVTRRFHASNSPTRMRRCSGPVASTLTL